MKRKNGEGSGNSFLVSLDPSRETDLKAKKMAQILAREGHGLRKELLVSFMAMLYDIHEQTGVIMSATEVSSRLMSGLIHGNSVPMGTSIPRDDIVIRSAATNASAEDIAEAFGGLGMFDSDDEDLW